MIRLISFLHSSIVGIFILYSHSVLSIPLVRSATAFSTNGINYDSEKVQNFIAKNANHLSIGLTIDGTQRKHDLNRICIRESVLHLFSFGIHEININCVFENIWNDGDDLRFENQLIALADEIIEQRLYEQNTCSFFSEHIGRPIDIRDNKNWCGAGKMLAIDAAGDFYPCTRFAAYSLRSKKPIIIGNVNDGIDKNKLRPFLTLDRITQSPQKCIDCEVASGCAWCQGENYDAAETPTIYQRSIAICKMHKAHVRANNYYWNKLFRVLELEGRIEEFERNKSKQTIEPC